MTFATWRDVLTWAILGIVALFGSPISQLVRQLFLAWFKVNIQDKAAVFLVIVMSALMALLEMWLSGTLTGVTIASFPAWFGGMVSVALVYWELFNESPGALGQGGLLKPLALPPVAPAAKPLVTK